MSALFVTGATGNIGSHLVRAIQPSQYERIFCMTRSDQLPFTTESNVSYFTGDLRFSTSYASQLDACEKVVHLASATGNASPKEHFSTNVEGTKVLLNECLARNIKKFVHISTIAVNFTNKKYYYYAQSKELAEQEVRTSGVNAIILRPTIVLAPDAPVWKRLLSLVRPKAVIVPGDGQVRIQPIHVQDVVQCIQAVLQDDRAGTMELGGPEAIDLQSFLLSVHHRKYGGSPRVVRIPIRLMASALGIAEKIVPLPFLVTAGQLSAFYNDSTTSSISVAEGAGISMKNINTMLDDLLANA